MNSFDAETFGSSDCSDQGRAEEEKKRRGIFFLYFLLVLKPRILKHCLSTTIILKK